jgi:hypothetical protein
MVNGAYCPKNPTECKKQTMMYTKTKPRKKVPGTEWPKMYLLDVGLQELHFVWY